MADSTCKRILEPTNAGHYFADCACGWSGGVHLGRKRAAEAWKAHKAGGQPIAPVRPVVTFGPRPHGQGPTGERA